MKKFLTLVIVLFLSTAVQMITSIPWWSFLVLLFILGVVIPFEKWKISSFLLGFASGFLAWLLSTLYFEAIYKGEILNAVSKMIAVPYFLLCIIIGLIGGILSGLAFYSGFLLRRGKEQLRLDIQKN